VSISNHIQANIALTDGPGSPVSVIRMVTIGVGSTCIALGLAVVVGWLLRTDYLIEIIPLLATMVFNTGLGLVLCGLGLVAVVVHDRRALNICGVAVLAIGGLTLLEYGLNANIGLDELFVRDHLLVNTSNPGRMAPVTALALVVGGGVISMLGNLLSRNRELPASRPSR